ncbi:MAG: Arc/MetJ family transcription regulator [Bradymonadia bacterium]|jgi:Arc/MetJ family transcription regulator
MSNLSQISARLEEAFGRLSRESARRVAIDAAELAVKRNRLDDELVALALRGVRSAEPVSDAVTAALATLVLDLDRDYFDRGDAGAPCDVDFAWARAAASLQFTALNLPARALYEAHFALNDTSLLERLVDAATQRL